MGLVGTHPTTHPTHTRIAVHTGSTHTHFAVYTPHTRSHTLGCLHATHPHTFTTTFLHLHHWDTPHVWVTHWFTTRFTTVYGSRSHTVVDWLKDFILRHTVLQFATCYTRACLRWFTTGTGCYGTLRAHCAALRAPLRAAALHAWRFTAAIPAALAYAAWVYAARHRVCTVWFAHTLHGSHTPRFYPHVLGSHLWFPVLRAPRAFVLHTHAVCAPHAHGLRTAHYAFAWLPAPHAPTLLGCCAHAPRRTAHAHRTHTHTFWLRPTPTQVRWFPSTFCSRLPHAHTAPATHHTHHPHTTHLDTRTHTTAAHWFTGSRT